MPYTRGWRVYRGRIYGRGVVRPNHPKKRIKRRPKARNPRPFPAPPIPYMPYRPRQKRRPRGRPLLPVKPLMPIPQRPTRRKPRYPRIRDPKYNHPKKKPDYRRMKRHGGGKRFMGAMKRGMVKHDIGVLSAIPYLLTGGRYGKVIY